MAQTTIQQVQQLYVAYFNRPAEPGGLAYWVNALANGGTLTDISTAFSQSGEYKASFAGLSNDAIVTQIYQNLFNRLPDQSGLNYWSGHLADGSLSISYIVDNISSSAVNNPTVSPADTAAITDKTAAAVAFTDLLNSDVNLRLAYSTPAAGQVGKAFLSSVSDDASLATATASLSTTVAAALTTAGQPIGTTSLLTIGQDTLVGTSANDTFNTFAVSSAGTVINTLSTLDSIDGGAGIDTLNLAASATTNDTLVGSVKNVEIINITGSNFIDGGVIKADFFAGATSISVDGKATSVTGVAAGEKIVFSAHDVLTAVTGGNVTYADGVTAGAVSVAGTSGTITVAGNKLATLSIDGTTHVDATTGPDTLTLVDGGTVKTLNVALTNDSVVSVAGLTALTAINAAASTGGVSITDATGSVANITTGSGDDTVTLATAFTTTVTTASVTTGTGDDSITVSTTGTGTFNVNAGAGNDTITLTAASALVAGDKIDGGDGNDTLVITNTGTLALGDYTTLTNAVTNVENLEFNNVAGVTADGTKLTQFTGLTFDHVSTITNASEAITAHDSITANAVGYSLGSGSTATVYAGTVNLTADGAASTLAISGDSAIVNVNALTADVGTTITGDLKTNLTVKLLNAADSATAPTTDTIASANIVVTNVAGHQSALTSITLSGNGSAVVDNSNGGVATKLVTIDASNLGGKYVNDTGAHLAGDITDGLTYTGNLAVTENITLGAGHDVVFVNSTAAHLDTITGFDLVKETAAGDSTTDVLHFGGLTIDGLTAAAITSIAVTGATDVNSAFAIAAQQSSAHAVGGVGAVVTFTLAGNTYLFQDAGVGAATPNGILDNTDLAVKLVGTVDLTTAFGVHA